jgi:NitT/TauT family transport system substrate-binding protein
MRLRRLGWNVVPILVASIGGFAAWWSGPEVRRLDPLVLWEFGLSDSCGLLGRPLRVGISTWPGYVGGIVANNGLRPNEDSIFFKKHGLCVEFILIEDADYGAREFTRGGGDGGIDIIWSTIDSLAIELPRFLKDRIKARTIMQVDWSRGGDAVVATAGIQRIEELRSKKVSLAITSQWLLEYSFRNSLLSDADQREIRMSLLRSKASPEARAFFVDKRVDVAVLREPDVTEALQKRIGSHILVSTREAQKLIANLMVARDDFIENHPDVIQAFVEGWLTGTEMANRNPEFAAKILMKNEALYGFLGYEVTRRNLATVKLAGIEDNVELFNLDDKDQQSLFDRIFRSAFLSWIKGGYMITPVRPFEAKDDTFLREIYKRHPVERFPDALPKPPSDIETKSAIEVKPITINFAQNSAALDAAAQRVIDEQVSFMAMTFSGAYIRVESNTDNTGNADANRALSRRRAQAVIDYLVSRHNLPANQFIAIGNGPDKPVASNDTPEGRARNRRTDISIVAR